MIIPNQDLRKPKNFNQFSGISQEVYDLMPTRSEFIGYDDSAIYNTLKKMKEIIIVSCTNPLVRRFAEKIVRGERTDKDKVESIYQFMAGHCEYLRDPHGFELLRTPLVGLQIIELGDVFSADCDDMVILSLSLLKSIGFPVVLRAASYKPDLKFKHVYGMVFIRDQGWTSIDCVRPIMGLGWEAPGATRIMNMEVLK